MQDDFQFVGIDLVSKYLVCRRLPKIKRRTKTIFNDPDGHQRLIIWLREDHLATRDCMKGTGVNSHLVAAMLSEQDQIEMSVLDPRVINSFKAARLQRGKTDAVDADSILKYMLGTPFEAWMPPDGKLV